MERFYWLNSARGKFKLAKNNSGSPAKVVCLQRFSLSGHAHNFAPRNGGVAFCRLKIYIPLNSMLCLFIAIMKKSFELSKLDNLSDGGYSTLKVNV